MVFSSPSSELLFLSGWNCSGDASVIPGEEETGAKRGKEGKKKRQAAEGSLLLPLHSPLPQTKCRIRLWLKDVAPSSLHKAQSPQWELLSTEQSWKTVVSWRRFAEWWALSKNLTWAVITEQQFWKLVPCESEMCNLYQHQSASA